MSNIKGRGGRSIIDQVYHSLRVANTELPIDAVEALGRIAHHLLSKDGDYPALLDFLSYYGTKYLSADILSAVACSRIQFERVVELGCGSGWTSNVISTRYGVPRLKTDNRQWSKDIVVIDLENVNGITHFKEMLVPNDLIVLSDVIHCLNLPTRSKLLYELIDYDVLVLEYLPERTTYTKSYSKQIRSKGCVPVNRRDMMQLGEGREIFNRQCVSHELYIYRKRIG